MINESDLEFLDAVWTRRPIYTYVFFAINIAIFILMEFAGGTTNEITLLAFGVKSNDLINRGELWRFITPIFIHIGILHLFFNSYALWIVGPQVEKLYGGAGFVLLYVLTGISGVRGSYWYHPQAVSAGASGAIFGLFGVLLVFGLRYRHNIPPFFKRAVGTGVLPVIIINLIIGFTIPAIDNSAHIGGLIAGMILASVVPFERPRSRTPYVFRLIQVALFAVILSGFGEVAAHYEGPRLSFKNVYRGWGQVLGNRSSVEEFIEVVNFAQRTFADSVRALDSNDKSELAKSRAETAKAIDQLEHIPSLSAKPDMLTQELLRLMRIQYELMQNVAQTGRVTLADDRRASENAKKYREVMDAFSEWVNSEGSRYGIQLRKPH